MTLTLKTCSWNIDNFERFEIKQHTVFWPIREWDVVFMSSITIVYVVCPQTFSYIVNVQCVIFRGCVRKPSAYWCDYDANLKSKKEKNFLEKKRGFYMIRIDISTFTIKCASLLISLILQNLNPIIVFNFWFVHFL